MLPRLRAILSDRRTQSLLSAAWQVSAVCLMSLGLIFMGSRLPSETPSIVVVEPWQLFACTRDVDGTLLGCEPSASAPALP